MSKITVFVKDGFKEYKMEDPINRINKNTYITLANATVFWKFNNILEGDVVKYGDAEDALNDTLTFGPGYWTFDMIQKELFSVEADIAKSRHNHKCNIVSMKYLDVGNLGPILRCEKNKIVAPFTNVKSPNSVDVNLGLRYLKVNCSAINSDTNKSDEGYRCKTLAYLPVTSEQILNGSAVNFPNLNSTVPLSNGCINQMDFTVMSNIPNPVDADVLLDIYIK